MPSSDFPHSPLPTVAVPPRVVVDNPSVPDVARALERITRNGDPLAAQDGGLFPPLTYTHVQVKGLNDAKNHFQGVQRLRRGRYLAVSGAFGTGARKQAHVFIVRMGSLPATRPWGSNVVFNARATERDAAVAVYGLGKTRWHGGGISVAGDVLVVPLQNGGTSSVEFLHAKDPEALERFDITITRSDVSKAGAAALTRLDDGRLVCAVWREVNAKPKGRIDFYVSRDTELSEGFDVKHPITWAFPDIVGFDRDPAYQNINFVWEERPSGTRTLFLLGTENGQLLSPLKNGGNFVDLFEVHLTSDMFGPGSSGAPAVEYKNSVELHGLRDYCNFAAGGGVYVDSDGSMHLYSCYHHRIESEIRFSEFRAYPADSIDAVQDAWIELYEHDRYRGKKLAIYGKTGASIRDYSTIFVDGGDFNRSVSSVRYQIPRGHTYRLFSERDFAMSRGAKRMDLEGKGEVVELWDLKRKPHRFGDTVASSCYL